MSFQISFSAANRIVALAPCSDHDDSALRNGPNSLAALDRVDPVQEHTPVQADAGAVTRPLEATFYSERSTFRINEKD